MLIDLKKIVEGGLHVGKELTFGPIDEDRDVEAVGPARVDVWVHEVDDEIVVSGEFETQVSLRCARCLRSFEHGVKDRFQSIFRPRPEQFDEDVRIKEEDLDLSYIDPDQDTLDLREIILEQVFLDLPMKPLHDEECRGLCPSCGVDRNEESCDCEPGEIDPRLEALAQIKARMEEADTSTEEPEES